MRAHQRQSSQTAAEEKEVSLSGNAYRNFIESIRSPFSRIVYSGILKAYMKANHYDSVNALVAAGSSTKTVKQIESEIISYIIKRRQAPSSLSYDTLNTIKACLVTFYAM